jgi:hypothetical protein
MRSLLPERRLLSLGGAPISGLAIVMAALTLYAPCRAQDEAPIGPPGVWAQVGEEYISKAEVEALRATTGGRLPVDVALDSIILEKVLLQNAAAEGISVVDSEVEAALADLKSRAEAQSSGSLRQMEAMGFGEASLRRNLRNQLLMNKKLAGQLTPQARELWFQEHRKQYVEQLRVERLVIRPREGESAEATRKRAEAILAKALSTADFPGLCREESDDPLAPFDGGDLGWIYPEQQKHDPVIRAARELERGAVHGKLIELGGRFSIVRLAATRIPEIALAEYPHQERVEFEMRLELSREMQKTWLSRTIVRRFAGAPGPSEAFPR